MWYCDALNWGIWNGNRASTWYFQEINAEENNSTNETHVGKS